MKRAQQMIDEHKEWNLKRNSIRQTNEELIRKWSSIPWYKFWQKPSFEEQRDIILSNWDELKILMIAQQSSESTTGEKEIWQQ